MEIKKRRIIIVFLIISVMIIGGGIYINHNTKFQITGKTEEGLEWKYNTVTKTLTITAANDHVEKMKDYWEENPAPWKNLKGKCKTVVIGEKIEYIGNGAFDNFKKLKRIRMSNDVKEIGEYAFFYCENLKEFKCPNDLKTIGYCAFEGSGLERVSFNEGLETIVSDAFQNTKIRKIELPNSLIHIGGNSFADNDNLESAIIPENVRFLDMELFANDNNLEKLQLRIKNINDLEFVCGETFSGINLNVKVEVPKDMLEEYKSKVYEWGLPEAATVVSFD